MTSLAAPDAESSAIHSDRMDGNAFSTMINLSGRRRFTSQRLVLFAVLASLGRDGTLEEAQNALLLFRGAHHTLLNGDARIPGLFCDQLKEAYFGPSRSQQKIADFMELAERALAAIGKGARGAAGLLDELVAAASSILPVLNQLTQLYEELAQAHERRVKKQLNHTMANIESIAKQARMVSFNAQIVAARSGDAGREFSVVAAVLSEITGQIDDLVRQVVRHSA